MYFEEIKRRPSNIGNDNNNWNNEREKRETREKPLEVKQTERKIPNDQKEKNMTHEEKKMDHLLQMTKENMRYRTM